MIDRIEVLLRRLHRWFDRSEWSVRLLRLSRTQAPVSAPGLILIQIDGLGRTQLERALAAGRMPFLRRLMKHEGYGLHTLYAGVPCTTPAVQAELFYGVKTAVPAFAFYEPACHGMVRMFEPTAAALFEQRLAAQGEPLIRDGASYSNIFTGGASQTEAHFCAAALGWGPVLRAANPLTIGFLVMANLYGALRVCTLLALELLISIVDAFRGIVRGHPFLSELKFIPARVIICIGLRELVTIGTKIDIARGLPIVHLNFVGYDEQSHRRGPQAKFAHWALKGIDDAIGRIWRAAKRSPHRDYRVWVYSDHGQEHSLPYAVANGRAIEDAVAEAFDGIKRDPARHRQWQGVQTHRANLLGGRRMQQLLPVYRQLPDEDRPDGLRVAALGPVGLVYAPERMSHAERRRLALVLVGAAKVPVVLAVAHDGCVTAWTEGGELSLPQEGDRLVGADHPFRAEVVEDLMALCRHPAAGDLVLLGWRVGARPQTFAFENGAHGGIGPEETRAFALLAADAVLPEREHDYLRAGDLRRAALHLLGRAPLPRAPRRATNGDARRCLRVMTYNVHSCRGMDGKLSPARIARVIAQAAPDVVALQELDVCRTRTGGVDQAHLIAQHLEMEFEFHPTVRVEEEHYGDAILTHLPMRLVRAQPLPGAAHLEPRGALWVAVDVDGIEVQIINTHLGLRPWERRLQIEALLSSDWLGHPACKSPVVLCGDFNATPDSYVCRRLQGRLRDGQRALNGRAPRNTWFSLYPMLRIDHIYVDPTIQVKDFAVPTTRIARIASDHLPLMADLQLPLRTDMERSALAGETEWETGAA